MLVLRLLIYGITFTLDWKGRPNQSSPISVVKYFDHKKCPSNDINNSCPLPTRYLLKNTDHSQKINKAVVFVLRENFIIFQWKHIPPNAFDLSAVSPIICYLNLTKWRFYQQNQIKSKSIQLNFLMSFFIFSLRLPLPIADFFTEISILAIYEWQSWIYMHRLTNR